MSVRVPVARLCCVCASFLCAPVLLVGGYVLMLGGCLWASVSGACVGVCSGGRRRVGRVLVLWYWQRRRRGVSGACRRVGRVRAGVRWRVLVRACVAVVWRLCLSVTR